MEKTTNLDISSVLDEYLNNLLTDSKTNQHYEKPNDDIAIVDDDDTMQEKEYY